MSTARTTQSAAKPAAKPRRRKTRTLPNAVTKAVGAALRARREKLELTQADVAYAGELERTRIGKMEGGHVNASVLSLASVCHVLGITLADLFADIRLSHPPTTEGGEPRRVNQAVLDKPARKKAARTSKVIASKSARSKPA
ncbi:MAG: XRE family transcriptional regulator [Betaproteobacteria bacterium]|nr:MAG: XRE family transcriptional regulator [Betaproteobacteria bacterium]